MEKLILLLLAMNMIEVDVVMAKIDVVRKR